jgi:OsmC subfamily peroxiredoxin
MLPRSTTPCCIGGSAQAAAARTGKGTNPEELLAAAHAGCFTMALSAQLAGAGLTAEKLATTCTITLEKGAEGFGITESHLDLVAKCRARARKRSIRHCRPLSPDALCRSCITRILR